MKMQLTKIIGRRKYPFVFEGDFHGVITESERLSFDDVPACGICASDNLRMTARVAKDKFKYVSIRCQDCRADLTFGRTQKDDQTYFLRRNAAGALDWREYNQREGQE